ncbi:MAG: hypothetical protein ACREQB_07145 [Candidatus Binataceae bacterium]
MPLRTKIDCPKCDADLVVKRAGVCPSCGAPITEHVARMRLREKRIEQAVAVAGTALVLAFVLFTSGAGLIEGVAVYAGVGALVFFLARRTFA